MKSIPVTPQQVDQAHELYCQLTGQRLSLGFDRQRLWFEVLRLGYGPEHIRRVVGYRSLTNQFPHALFGLRQSPIEQLKNLEGNLRAVAATLGEGGKRK